MIQDIEPYSYNNAYKPEAPDKESFIIIAIIMHISRRRRTKKVLLFTAMEWKCS